MRYILFLLFVFQTIFAGREFIDDSQIRKLIAQLHEFKLRHLMLTAQLNSTKRSEQEYEKTCHDFKKLWEEIESKKSVFVAYFGIDNDTVRKQKSFYNELISEIAETKKELAIAGHAMTNYLNRNVLLS